MKCLSGRSFAALAMLLVPACGRTPTPTPEPVTITRAEIASTMPSTKHECTEDERPTPNEGLREPAGLGGCPPGMAPIATEPGRCIDRWEAFLVELGSDGTERSVSPFFNPEGKTVRAKSAPGAVPQGYIDEHQAARACELAGKRLCTDEEWLAACRGADAQEFPYGREERLGTCNDHRESNPALDDLAAKKPRESGDQTKLLHDSCVNQQPHTVARTGSKPGCATREQVYDLVGNVHEWTSNPKGAFRGGFYADTEQNGRGCNYVTTAHDPTYWDYSTGFRCCSDRE